MNRDDLLKMIDAAKALTAAAQLHESALQALLDKFTGCAEDARDTGYAFEPVSQALAHWRNLMSVIFPTPEDDPAKMAALAATLETWRKAP